MTAIQLNSDFQLLLGWISKMIFVKKATEGIFSGLVDYQILSV